MSVVLPPVIYGYGDQRTQDHGYGCTYRNIQTMLGILGVTLVPTVRELMSDMNIAYTPQFKQRMWIEPIQAKELIERYTGKKMMTALYTKDTQKAQRRILRNLSSEYQHITPNRAKFDHLVRRGITLGAPVLIDNGISSYLILGKEGDKYVIGDPHEEDPTRRVKRMSMDNFYQNHTVWMATMLR